jgi:predicted RNA-binding protein with PIN domain
MQETHREIIIDGYNLIYRLFHPENACLLSDLREQTEAALSKYLQKRRLHGTVVYDGGTVRGSSFRSGRIDTVFPGSGTSADQWIIDHVREKASKACMTTVVSSDREIRQFVSAFGAGWMSSESFAEELGRSGCGFRQEKQGKKYGERDHSGKNHETALDRREIMYWRALFDPEK